MAKNKSIEEIFISAQYKDFKYLLYKCIIKESMIWLQKEFKKNQKIKEDIIESWGDLRIKEDKSIKEKMFLYRNLKKYNNAKTNWSELDDYLKKYKAQKFNKDIYATYSTKMANCWLIVDNEFDNNLISSKDLNAMVDRAMQWLKKNFNRLSQFKRYKKKKNKENYENTKVARGIKTRGEANQKIAEDRRFASKSVVLEFVQILKSKGIKITIHNIKNEIENKNAQLLANNSEEKIKLVKLGTSQISVYLKTLKQEGLV